MSQRRNTTAGMPIHPGEVLLEQFLEPAGLSQYKLARAIGVPPRRINELVLGKRGISADTALRLARFFGTAPELWLQLQNQYDLDRAQIVLQGKLETIQPLATREGSPG
ncbi:MAG: HigA family addiction module antitoxin [Halorhodospira halophila]|uniref:HigA family addiction module antitoxin n=1 Tax=Halorhodospira TaxID=85108 RepID=UPI0019132AAC|nr:MULTISPECIES: HigA family addiction module antitoxin [Halorhodospira]MBK5936409.1 addiction module antidote protein, HigA family [Halorhodospira halophila]MBK5943987.1 addiction module antidote protein, HigA family [Halorhodospira halophila]MCC3750426.1 HigA family addiction module antitoxin [Halorhodospira halophila]MCG5527898.1 HigA family addiction module antitoxin [Halorhodospira halophila]MCG5533226.1 HigA family addiction module antitoxin [Halorhodospira sp. 9621]